MPPIHDRAPLNSEVHGASEEVDHIEYGNGIKMFLKGHPHPFKGMPTIHAISAINVIKEILKLNLKQAMYEAIEPHILKTDYMCDFSREIRRAFPSRMGLIISHLFEYDWAYRLRFQDLIMNTSKERLLSRPLSTIRRLKNISKGKDYKEAHAKMKWMLNALALALLWPPFRKRFKELDFMALKLDFIDTYWLSKRVDYGDKTVR